MLQYTLRARLIFFAVVLVVATTTGMAFVTERAAAGKLSKRIGEELMRGSSELNSKLDRGLGVRFADVELHAELLSDLGLLKKTGVVRDWLGALQTAYPGFAWIGFADAGGRVIAASQGMLEGQNVSGRTWFASAKKAPYVGGLHRAVLLEKKLNAGRTEPLRFLDFAVPVTTKHGALAGVLGAHVDWQWLNELSKSTSHAARSELLIVGADGVVLFGPPDLQDRPLRLRTAQQAQSSANGYFIEKWSDGKTYLTGYSQSTGYESLPGMGWTVLCRQEIGEAFGDVTALRIQFVFLGFGVAILAALLGWFAAARIARPLDAITTAAEYLGRGGKTGTIPAVKGYREVIVLARTLRKLLRKLAQREAQLEHQATHNLVTQLPNRALIKALIEQIATRAGKENRRVAILAVSLDRLKPVLDTIGHDAGTTAALRIASERLSACIDESAVVGYLDNDKFAVVLEARELDSTQAAAYAARVQEVIAKPFLIASEEFFLSASVGISLFPDDAQSAGALLTCSEAALYQAKAQKVGHIAFYEATMDTSVRARLELEREMRQALEKGQFELHYQPQVSLDSGSVVGVEALIRWRHPEMGLVSPAKFIPVAESSGLIVPIGNWVLNTACAQVAAWRKQGLPPLQLGINVSAHQFAHGDLVMRVSEALERHGVAPGSLKLEITESLLMQEVESSILIMRDLANIGVHIALDDFGTGYSSLSYLKRFPITELKIDQSFVRDLNSHSEDAAIVRAIIAMGHSLQLRVIAEGVETAEQLHFLRHAGCDEMQGYFFSRPVPPEQVADLVRQHRGAASQRGTGTSLPGDGHTVADALIARSDT